MTDPMGSSIRLRRRSTLTDVTSTGSSRIDQTRRSRLLRSVLATLLGVAGVWVVAPAAPAAAAVLPNGASAYVAMTPQRLADTRPSQGSYGYSAVNSKTIRIGVLNRDGVPADAIAVVVNVTVIGSSGSGYVTVYPAGQALPTTSNVNADAAGRTVANMAHVKIGSGGSIDLFRSSTMNVAVDLVGVYVPVADATSAGRLTTLASGAVRALDTRQRGYGVGVNSTTTVDLAPFGLPTGASAALVTVTAVQGYPGFWTAFPTGITRPNVSTLNLDTAGQTRAGQAIVPLLSGNRTINVFSANGGHLLVDLVGWYTGDGVAASTDGLFVPSAPMRLLDTRALRTLAPWGGSTYEFQVGAPFSGISAVALNITGTQPWDGGYVTAHPAGVARPNSSNLNLTGWGQVIANHAISRVSARGVALFTNAGVHLIGDVAGWFLGTPSTATLPVPANPNYTSNKTTAVHAGELGLYVAVKSGTNLDYIADQGYAATWSDLANVATPGNVMLFAHRTTGSAPFRYINGLTPGDNFSLIGTDGHWYHYRVVDQRVTSPYYSTISSVASAHGPMTAQLVACSKLNGTPTSTLYRIVITGRLYAVT